MLVADQAHEGSRVESEKGADAGLRLTRTKQAEAVFGWREKWNGLGAIGQCITSCDGPRRRLGREREGVVGLLHLVYSA